MRGRSLRRLMASSSVAALLLGGGASTALAVPQCSINDINQSVGTVTNTGSINCINIQNSTVTGNITNSAGASIHATGGAPPSRTGITVNGGSVSGAIINAGSITAVNGSGIVVENNAVVSGGITNIGTITHTQNSEIVLNNLATFGGGVSNSGTITSGRYAIYLDSVQTFSGGIVNTGKFITTSASGIYMGSIGTFLGGVNNSGIIASTADTGINFNGVSVWQGGITNSGTISGGYALELDTITTFFGGIVNTGSLLGRSIGIQVFGGSTFSGGITNHGMIAGASQTGIQVRLVSTFIGGITNTGTISGNESGIVAESSGPISIFDSGKIIGGGGTDSEGNTGTAIDLLNNSAGNTLTLGPGFSIVGKVLGATGGGDTFQLGGTGNGTFDLSTIGAGAQFENFTTFNVVGGVWTVSNTFGQSQTWNVNGGTLAGTGTLPGVIVNSGGTLEPGIIGTPGTIMTINGNLTFQNGATYVVNIGPTTASRVNVTGTATLAGAVQGILAPGSYSAKTTYDILDPPPPHVITGTFTGFSSPNAPGFGGTLTYTSTDVLLNLTANIGAGGGLTPNQQGVANAINTFFNNGGTLPAAFFPAFGLSGGSVLSQLSGEAATGAAQGANQLMSQFLTLMLDPNVDGRGGATAMPLAPERLADFPPDVALAYASVFKAPPKPVAPEPRVTTWGAAFGGYNRTDGDPGAGTNALSARDFGFAGGVDYRLSRDTIVGFALAGGSTNWGLAAGLGGGNSDAFQAGLYGKTYFGSAYLAGALAFANHWMTTDRNALGDQLTASLNGQSFGVRAEAGDRIAYRMIGVTPYGALQIQTFHTPAYSETDQTGGGLGLTFNAMTATDTRSELGARFDDPTMLGGMPLILRGKLAWAHDWVSNPSLGAVFQALPGGAFTVNGAAPAHDSALTSAGAQLFLTSSWSLAGKFDGEFAAGSQTYAGTATLKHTW